jgi:hypothetical protein
MTETTRVREAVAVFERAEDLEAAVDALVTHGFGRADLSLLASDTAIRAKLGHSYASTRDAEDDPEAPTTAYVAREDVGDAEGAAIGGLLYVGAMAGMIPVFASGGAVGAAILAALVGGGAGGALGGVLAHLIGKRHAESLGRQIEQGGLVLWVRTHDEAHEMKATAILKEHGGRDVHVHGLPDHAGATAAEPALPDLPAAARLRHAGYDMLVMQDGHCYAAGRLFPSEADARRHLDQLGLEP